MRKAREIARRYRFAKRVVTPKETENETSWRFVLGKNSLKRETVNVKLLILYLVISEQRVYDILDECLLFTENWFLVVQ